MRGSPDLLVVGGGPAGLATAIAARQRGLSVRLVDLAEPPIDKACGEGLMPEGVAVLQRLGVAIAPEDRVPFVGIRYIDGDRIARGSFPGEAGWGVRRLALHRALVRTAEEAGVLLNWGVAARALEGGGVQTTAGPMHSRWIAAADGLRSTLRAAAGLEGPRAKRARLGLRRHYRVPPWTDLVEVYWSDGLEAYVTPVAADTVGVALLFEGARPDSRAAIARFPSLEARIGTAHPASSEKGAGPLERRVRGVVRGNLALVGDAAGYVDALTGEGLTVAFREAEALAEALETGDLGRYRAAHRRIVRLPEGMTRLLLAVEGRPWLRRRVVTALAADPKLFDDLLAIHVGVRPLGRAAPRAAARLAWRLLGTEGGAAV